MTSAKPQKLALITGAARGIGLELVRLGLEKGWRVFALSRKGVAEPGLAALAGKHADHLRLLRCDLSDERQVSGLRAQLSGAESLDLLINNAGVYLDSDANFEALSSENILKSFQVNALAPLLLTRELLPWLRMSKDAKVVHVTSLMGSLTDNRGGGAYGYRMSKAALNMFHRSLAADNPWLTSLVVHPGWVKTEMGGSSAPTEIAESAAGIWNVIETTSRPESGSFKDYRGRTLPW